MYTCFLHRHDKGKTLKSINCFINAKDKEKLSLNLTPLEIKSHVFSKF
jgi:hypothetical protein